MSKFKIIHTSDWHLGKKLFKNERMQEHQSFLDWLYHYILDNNINLLLIAGDIFDVPTPPNQAQKMFYDFIYKIGKIENFETVVITGNHDSSSLFEIPKPFFKEHNCTIYSGLYQDLSKLEHYIEFNSKTIGIKLLPYFRNFELINHIPQNNDQAIEEEEEIKVERFFNNFFTDWKKDKLDFRILMAHHGFGQYNASGSEHAIFLSGIDHFPLRWLTGKFDYVALGHIHKKQKLSSEPLTFYPGSPIPLRFSEKNKKYIAQIVLTQDGFDHQEIQIPIFKKLVQIKSNDKKYKEDINSLVEVTKTDPTEIFLEIIIELTDAKSGIADHIRDLIKDTPIKLISFIPRINSTLNRELDYTHVTKLNLNQLFEKYYKHKYDVDSIPIHMAQNFQNLLEDIKNENS